jgi:hypothetical protein
LFFQLEQYFSLTTNQSIVFFSRLINTAERDHWHSHWHSRGAYQHSRLISIMRAVASWDENLWQSSTTCMHRRPVHAYACNFFPDNECTSGRGWMHLVHLCWNLVYTEMLWEKNIVLWLKSSSSEQGGKFYVPSHVDLGNNNNNKRGRTYLLSIKWRASWCRSEASIWRSPAPRPPRQRTIAPCWTGTEW